jgi:hypothetical protein
MPMHEPLNGEATGGGGGCRIGGRAKAALLTLGLVALGVHIGLMIDIAHSDREQVAATAPTVDGSGAMAFCVVQGVYRGGFDGNVYQQATLESDVTKALGKGCTLAGAFTPVPAGNTATGVQPMLCPKAMVGTIPAGSTTGNTGECVV